MRVFWGILSAVWLATAGHAGDETVNFGSADPAMSAAIAEAQGTLPLFLANTLDTEGYGAPGAMLKVAFPIGGGEVENEVIWVSPFVRTADSAFIGLLANAPVWMEGLKQGDRVEFSAAQISDWSVAGPDGTLLGNYTTRVMVPHMDAATAEQISALLAPAPIPENW